MISIFSLIVQSLPFTGSAVVVGIWTHKFLHKTGRRVRGGSGDVNNGGESVSTGGNVIIQLLSDVTVAFATVVAELVLCEIGDWVDPEARFVVWKVATTVLLALLALIIPLAEILVFVLPKDPNKKSERKNKLPFIILGAFLYVLYLIVFISLGNYIPLDKSGRPGTGTTFAADLQLSFSEQVITRIGFVGVTAMAILCGISSVSAPYIVFISKPKPVNESDIDRLQAAISTTGMLIETKRNTLQSLRLKLTHRIQNSSTSNLMFKVLSSLRVGGDDLATEIKALENEINSLQAMHSDLERDIESLKSRYQNQLHSQTLIGRVGIQLNFVFAIYCLYRLINILIIRNPFISWGFLKYHGSGESDALVISLAHIVLLISPLSDLEALSRQIGFAVSGLLFLASISSVATTFNTLSKAFPFLHHHSRISNSGSGSRETTGLVISQVLAVYVISTSLLLRSNLPTKMSSAITSALGAPLNVNSVQAWSDDVIFMSTCLVIVVLWLASKYRVDETVYDEESALEGKFD